MLSTTFQSYQTPIQVAGHHQSPHVMPGGIFFTTFKVMKDNPIEQYVRSLFQQDANQCLSITNTSDMCGLFQKLGKMPFMAHLFKSAK